MARISDRDELIKNVLSRFNVYQVHQIMKYMGWTWAPKFVIPTCDEIYEESKRLLEGVYDEAILKQERSTLSTGGLSAEAYFYQDDLDLIIEFVPVSAESW